MKEWTIMVYMAGDNELSEDMATALRAMKAYAGNRNMNVVALYDSSYPPVPITLYDFSTLPTASAKASALTIKDFADIDIVRDILGLPPARNPAQTEPYEFDISKEFVPIKKFVPWVLRQNKYKAKKYALILSGHSDGIIGRTILRDDSPPNVLNLTKLAAVLHFCRKFLPRSTHPQRRFDLLGFDGCLMGMLEAAYEMKDVASYMVASEGNIPYSGWNYSEFLAGVSTSLGPDGAKKLAKSTVRRYARCNHDYITSGRAVNISAFDLQETTNFARWINTIAGLLHRLLEVDPQSRTAVKKMVFREMFISFVLKSHYAAQTFMHSQAVDVMDFLYRLIDHWYFHQQQTRLLSGRYEKSFQTSLDSLVTNYIELQDVFKRFVIASCFVGAEYQFSKGVSLFFPWNQMALNLLSFQYRELKFDGHRKNWGKFFRKYVELTLRTPDTRSFIETVLTSQVQAAPIGNAPVLPDAGQNAFLQFATDKDKTGKEYIGREYIGREYIGRGTGFYGHFSQVQNYSHFKRVNDPPPPHNEVDIKGCNDPETL